MGSFKGRNIVVTGGASGIGLATAQLLASKGARVSLADLSEDKLQAAIKTLSSPEKHMYKVVDVRDTASVDAWIEATVQDFGKVDGAVNMAGVSTQKRNISDMLDEAYDFVFGVNIMGVFKCLRAEMRAMKTGAIVSAASTMGQYGVPGNSLYAASKAAVISATRSAAKENKNIRVNAVAPGSTVTGMSPPKDNPEHIARVMSTVQQRRADPIELANVIVFLLSDEASFVTGAIYNVDGGWIC